MLRKVSILGASLDVGNRGVLALGVSLAWLIRRTSSETKVAFHYGNATGGVRQIVGACGTMQVEVRNCRLSPRSAPAEHILVILALAGLYRLGFRRFPARNPWIASLLSADFIGDIRGGDSFSDIYGLRRFFSGSLPLLTVALLGRPYVMLPQTYGPFRGWAARRLASFLLRRAKTIVTRDRKCESTVRQLCGRSPRFCPDVAFTMEPVRPKHVKIVPSELPLDDSELIVGLNVSGLLYMGGYTGRNMFGLRVEYRDLVNRLMDSLLRSTAAKILVVPHEFGFEQEQEASWSLLRSVTDRYHARVFTPAHPLGERELKWVIGRTHLFVGSRMHACIAALSQCVPALGLAYSDKFLGVFESAGVGDSIIDLRRADVSEVIGRTLSALERRTELKERLQSQIRAVQDDVFNTFGELLSDAT